MERMFPIILTTFTSNYHFLFFKTISVALDIVSGIFLLDTSKHNFKAQSYEQSLPNVLRLSQRFTVTLVIELLFFYFKP